MIKHHTAQHTYLKAETVACLYGPTGTHHKNDTKHTVNVFNALETGCIAQGQCACSLAANRACNALTCSCPEYVKKGTEQKLRIKRTFVTLLKLKWNRWGIMRIQIFMCRIGISSSVCHAQHGHLPTTRCSSLHQCRTAAAQGFPHQDWKTTRTRQIQSDSDMYKSCIKYSIHTVLLASWERETMFVSSLDLAFQMPLTTVTSCDIVGGGWYCAVDADSPGHRIENRRQHWERYSMPQLDCSAVGYGFCKTKAVFNFCRRSHCFFTQGGFQNGKICFCVPLGPHFAVGTCPQCHRGVLSLGELCAKAAIKGPSAFASTASSGLQGPSRTRRIPRVTAMN